MRLRTSRPPAGLVRSPEEAERRRIPWGKYIYLAILLTIVVLAGRWAVEKSSYITGDGLVSGRPVDVAARSLSRIREVKVQVLDAVAQGEPVVTLELTEVAERITDKTRGYEERIARLESQRLDAETALTGARAKARSQEAAVAQFEAEWQAVSALVEAGAATRGELARVERDLEPARRELALLTLDAQLAESVLSAREAELAQARQAMQADLAGLQALLEDEVLLAPCAGVVTTVHKQPGEVVRPAEAIVTIADTSDLYVTAYFRDTVEPFLTPDAPVRLVFESGEGCNGRVRKVHPRALPLAPEYEQRFGPAEPYVVAEVVPVDASLAGRVLGTRVKLLIERRWLRQVRTELGSEAEPAKSPASSASPVPSGR